MPFHSLIKRIARGCGLDIVRWSPRIGCEREAFYAIPHILRADSVRTVFDVGANIGQSAETYLSMFPRADVWSFEPFPEACAQMRSRVGGNPRAHAQQCAVSDAPGLATFHVNAASETNSILPTLTESAVIAGQQDVMRTDRTIQVPVVSIDEFCRDNGIDQIDLLKIDVQGVADRVLRGAAKMLEQKRIRLIYVEVMFMQIYQGEPRFAELEHLVQGFGYPLYRLYNLQSPRGRLGWGDAIFLRPDLLERVPD